MLSAACWSAVGTSSPAKSGPVQTHRDTNISLVLICCASSILSCICSDYAELKRAMLQHRACPHAGPFGVLCCADLCCLVPDDKSHLNWQSGKKVQKAMVEVLYTAPLQACNRVSATCCVSTLYVLREVGECSCSESFAMTSNENYSLQSQLTLRSMMLLCLDWLKLFLATKFLCAIKASQAWSPLRADL